MNVTKKMLQQDLIINNLINHIKNGNVVSFPTETVYALSCDANNFRAIENIYNIKNRNKNKLFSIFVDFTLLNNFVVYENKLKQLINEELKNGTTIIFNKKNNDILPFIESETVGIRIPKHDFTRKLLQKIQEPLVATSVNTSGEPPLYNYYNIIENFPQIPYVVNNDLISNSEISGKPSKIISVVDGDVKILRE